LCGGSHSLTADEGSVTKESTPLVKKRQTDGQNLEACYWYVNPEKDEWTDDSHIWIYPEAFTNTKLYIYQGNDRRNATKVTEDNSNVVVGAPIRVPVGNGAIVVL